MDRKMFLEMDAEFSWNYGNEFFLETSIGNFTWSDPSYPGGTNEIRPFFGDLKKYLSTRNIPYLRDKGIHKISEYCGEDVELKFDLNDFKKGV